MGTFQLILDSFIEVFTTLFTYIKGFISLLLSIPTILSTWYNVLPPFIGTGMLIMLLIVTACIVMQVIVLIKGVL